MEHQDPMEEMSSAMPTQGDDGPRAGERGATVRQAHKRRRTPTIRDVATLAGVSIGTVSKSLNGREGAPTLGTCRRRCRRPPSNWASTRMPWPGTCSLGGASQ